MLLAQLKNLHEAKNVKASVHPTKKGYVYDPELSDNVTAGFTDERGEQTYVKRSALPVTHPESVQNFKKSKTF